MSSGNRAFNILRAYIGREYERMTGQEEQEAWHELDVPVVPTAPKPSTPKKLTPEEELQLARVILGVDETASFDEVRKAFERLSTRSDPSRFPEKSELRAQAELIHRRVTVAYSRLAEKFSSTEQRFRSLEID